MVRTRRKHGRSPEPDGLGPNSSDSGGPDGAADVPGGPAAGELLTMSPFGDDLADELATEPRRPRLPGPTLLLGAAVLMVAGFIGGAQAQRLWGADAGGTAAAGGLPGGAQGMPGVSAGTGQRGSAAGGGFGGAAGGTAGTVQKVSGKVIYLKTAAGDTVKITTTGSTKVLLSTTGKVGDLKAGATVVVQGASGTGGAVTATSVSESSGLPGGMPGGPPS